MLDRPRIAALIPHGGSMCLLHAALSWDDRRILCRARSHLDPANPLRRAGRLAAVCGIEYGLQAAALHGALRPGASRESGFLAALREVVLRTDRLDDAAFGTLAISAHLQFEDAGGSIYSFLVAAEGGERLIEGSGTIAIKGC